MVRAMILYGLHKSDWYVGEPRSHSQLRGVPLMSKNVSSSSVQAVGAAVLGPPVGANVGSPVGSIVGG